MTRHLSPAIVRATTALFVSSTTAFASIQQCEDKHVYCLGRCADMSGRAGDWGGRQNKCLPFCDWRLRCVDPPLMPSLSVDIDQAGAARSDFMMCPRG